MIVSKRAFFSLAAGASLLVAAGAAAQVPQQPTDAPRNVPDLKLTPEQKHTIYQALAGPQAKNNPEPVGFRAAPGAHVPEAIKLEPMPKVVSELVPKLADYQFAVVSRQVIIVDPHTSTVVEAISQ
ncbi:MAG: DUF1236 domain-containing protein [Hyphomicrobiales bacterium]|nr:DUF1236 domain-containing protein [Hyphomicrobiales bacterium]MBV8826500.1 DUF1236 domain-containing protein [Hyphomicrobiales bacterium]MBV9426402.1 DUF1236 domain-containing protein [Bradyrhizobiaceae bacterium]